MRKQAGEDEMAKVKLLLTFQPCLALPLGRPGPYTLSLWGAMHPCVMSG